MKRWVEEGRRRRRGRKSLGEERGGEEPKDEGSR